MGWPSDASVKSDSFGVFLWPTACSLSPLEPLKGHIPSGWWELEMLLGGDGSGSALSRDGKSSLGEGDHMGRG